MALISLDQVEKIYPNSPRPALENIDLHIDRGDFVFLVGASGSGKTSLLRLLLREEEATAGEIRVAGYDLRRLPNRQVPQYRRSIGMIFQDYKLLPNKTVWENVAFALEVIGTSRSAIRSMVPKVLKTVGLTGKENSKPQELSGGEQQRVTIARAYVNHPQILLADEPTGNLDPTTSLGIMEVLDAINRTGTTIVMATHNEEIVNSMRKRVVELHNGHIVRDQEHGVYDSAEYFPDKQVEANAQQAREESEIVLTQRVVMQEPTTNRERRANAQTAVESVQEIVESNTSGEGIARLAQNMHKGKKGRYGEAFAPVEETLTWGGGLSLEELAERERKAEQESGSAKQYEMVEEIVEEDITDSTQEPAKSAIPEPPQPPSSSKTSQEKKDVSVPTGIPQPPQPPQKSQVNQSNKQEQ